MQVAATGGPTTIIPTRLANFQSTALSRDGSYLLGAAGDAFALPFWAVPLPSGEPHRLRSIIGQDADLFPDGRILFCLGNDINVAEKDGAQPRKLLSVDGLPVEPSVSPDGERFVFTIWSPAHRPTRSTRPRQTAQISMSSSGTAPPDVFAVLDGRPMAATLSTRTDMRGAPISGSCRCNPDFCAARHLRSSSPMVRFLSSGRLQPRWEADFCCRHGGAGRTGPLRRKFQAVPPSAPRHPRFRSVLVGKRQVGRLHRLPRSRVVAQPQRRNGSLAAYVSTRAGIWPLHFPGWEAGRVCQFRGRDLPDRYGRRVALDYRGEGRDLAALVAGRKPPGVHGSWRFPPYPLPRSPHRQEFPGSRTGRHVESAVGGRRSAGSRHRGLHEADGF